MSTIVQRKLQDPLIRFAFLSEIPKEDLSMVDGVPVLESV